MTHSPDHPNLLDVEIRDLSNEGDGIGQSEGRIVFVEGALPGERVETRLVGGSRGMLRGELRTLHQASPERRQPPAFWRRIAAVAAFSIGAIGPKPSGRNRRFSNRSPAWGA